MVDLFGNADGSTAMAAKKEVPTLYEYQERAVQRLRDNLLAGVERQILGLPTGSAVSAILRFTPPFVAPMQASSRVENASCQATP